jgi:hypothetical protein
MSAPTSPFPLSPLKRFATAASLALLLLGSSGRAQAQEAAAEKAAPAKAAADKAAPAKAVAEKAAPAKETAAADKADAKEKAAAEKAAAKEKAAAEKAAAKEKAAAEKAAAKEKVAATKDKAAAEKATPAAETAQPVHSATKPAAEAAPPAAPAPTGIAPAPLPPPPLPVPPPAPVVILPPPPPPAPPVEWKVQSKGGFLMTSGNSQATNGTFGVNGSRKEGNNKLSLEGGIAYGKSKNLTAPPPEVDPVTNTPTITSLDRKSVVSTNNWATKGRYDRFLSENNTAYASTQWGGDKIAGKKLFGGGQIGYSRQLYKDEMVLLVAELGYDFSYERYVQQPGKTVDPVTIHSARVLLGGTLSLTESTGLTASAETLLNLNKENKAIDARNGNKGVAALDDTRVNAKAGITTNLWKKLSLGLSFGLKYDQNPAPRPIPAGMPAGTSYPSKYVEWAFADKVDTITEATLIYTFF